MTSNGVTSSITRRAHDRQADDRQADDRHVVGASADGRPSRARRIVCWTTIAAVLPYLTIKLLWISGSPVGVVDLSALHNRALQFLNTLTFGMDVLAAVVALALTYAWGRRLPAWLLVLPMWVASGLLGALLVVVPTKLLWDAATHTPILAGDGFLKPWVYAVVYSGFITQGLCLLTAFALHSRSRWPILRGRSDDVQDVQNVQNVEEVQQAGSPAPSSSRVRPLARLAALTAVPPLYWGFGGTVGNLAVATNPGQASGAGGVSTLELARGTAALLAAAGALGLLRGLTWRRSTAVWFGTAVMVAWGLWTGLLTFVSSPVTGNAHDLGSGLPETLASGAQVVLGVALARTTLRIVRSRMTERRLPDKIVA